MPKEYQDAIRVMEIDGRKKVVVKGKISAYIPNPTFEVVAAPGSGMEYFAAKNTAGKSFREIVTPMKSIPEFNDPARLDLMDRMHVDAVVNFPTLASVVEVNFMDDPITSRRCPRVQPVAVRRLGLQPPRPHLHHAGDEPVDRRGCDQGARVGARA